MAREFLWQTAGLCGTPEKQHLRETVCNLIRYHSFPPHAIDDPDGKRKLMAIAANGENCPMFTIELLCILCRADALGRKCADKALMLEQIDLCAELAAENECDHGPFPFPSCHTRYSYLSGRDIAPELTLYDDTWGEVILLSGLPGTGKDTWIMENCLDLPMISLDEIRREMKISPTDNQAKVVELARERAKELLRRKQPLIWNATNVSPMVRGKQIRLFTQYHASTRIVYLETDWNEQLRRNAGRADAVPQQVICHMMNELIVPEVKEAHKVEWFCV
jgi:predicted kinase